MGKNYNTDTITGGRRLRLPPVAPIVMALLLLSALVSCAAADDYAAATIDIEAVALKICENVPFDDELIRLSDQAVAFSYNFGGAETVVYAGGGATAEVIIIVGCEDIADTDGVHSKLNDYIKAQKTRFTDYNDWELPKLADSVVAVYGHYVFCCVSAHPDAVVLIIEEEFETE